MFRRSLWPCLYTVGLLVAARPGHALPKFAREYGVSCQTCHSVAPRLNTFGEAFRANHFNWPNGNPPARPQGLKALPMSGVARLQCEKSGADESRTGYTELALFFAGGFRTGTRRPGGYMLCVIAGASGSGGDWGALEDSFISLPVAGKRGQWAVTVGQVTPLMCQWWHHTRLSAAPPLALSLGGLGDTYGHRGDGADDEDAGHEGHESEEGGHGEGGAGEHRVHSASVDGHHATGETFSLGDHVPSLRLDFFSGRGNGTADGYYVTIGVPFEGELALNSRARLGSSRGLFAHALRRQGDKTLGAFAYTHAGEYLAGMIGTHPLRSNLYLLGVGAIGKETQGSTRRLSLEGEYLASPRWGFTARLEAIGGEHETTGTGAAVTYYPLKLSVLRLTLETTQRKGHHAVSLAARGQF